MFFEISAQHGNVYLNVKLRSDSVIFLRDFQLLCMDKLYFYFYTISINMYLYSYIVLLKYINSELNTLIVHGI